MVLGYRVENQNQGHGIWRNFDGSWNPVFSRLSDGQCKNMPMEDSSLYRTDGKRWFSAAPSKDTLKHWFSKQDALELAALGYKAYEFELENTMTVSEFEIVFTRDNIVSQKEIDYKEIWDD